MSNKSTEKVSVVSGDTQNAADVNNGRSTIELHHQSDVMYPMFDREAMSYMYNGCGCVDSSESVIDFSKDFFTPSEIKKMLEVFEDEEEEEEKKEEVEEAKKVEESSDNIQQVHEKNEEQGFHELYLACQRHSMDTARSFLMSSFDVDVLEANKDNIPQLYAIAKELLNKKISIDQRNAFDPTLIHMAFRNHLLRSAHKLLKDNEDPIRLSTTVSCNTSLLSNADMSCAEVVKALIEYVGGINAVDENGDTALHLAARNDRKALEKILINRSTERDTRSGFKLVVNQVHPDELELSQQSSRDQVDVGQIPHHLDTHDGNIEIARTSLGRHINVMAISTEQETPLQVHLVSGREHAEIVESLILNGANVNACNTKTMTPLHLACENGHSSIVEILLDNNANVDVNKQAWETPFSLAAKNGHADVVDVLLRRGICDFVLGNFYSTPLHDAVEGRHTKVVEVILKHSRRIYGNLPKEEQNFEDNMKNLAETRNITPIELVKLDGRRVSAEIVWTEKTMPLETMPDYKGRTALELAVTSIQPKMVKMLLSADRWVYSEKDIGNSFLCMIETIGLLSIHYKIRKQHINITDLMEIMYHDVQVKMNCKNIKEIARLLINSCKFNVNYQDDHLNTLLHAAINQCKECLYDYLAETAGPRRLILKSRDYVTQLLLEKGADFNMTNASCKTPLIIASERGCSHAIQKLFDWEQKSGLKLDLDARDQDGATALIKAAESHHVSVMRLLLSHKASVNLHDVHGITALHAAVFEPIKSWSDLHFSSSGLLKRKRDYLDEYHEILRCRGQATCGELAMDRFTTNPELEGKYRFRFNQKPIQFTEMVKLFLAIDETNVNARDFRGNTPLDLAAKSSIRINLETFEALKDRGAIRTVREPEDEVPFKVEMVDERDRSPLHRLILSNSCNLADEDMMLVEKELGYVWSDIFSGGISEKLDDFWQSTTANDEEEGITPPQHLEMPPSDISEQAHDIVRAPQEIGINVNAVDMYGKTPLHYAEMFKQCKLLIKHGADETIKDKNGYTAKDLRQLRKSVTTKLYDAMRRPVIANSEFYTSTDVAHALRIVRVTELSKRKLTELVRVHSQSPRPKESSEEVIWKIWIKNDFPGLNRRINKLKPSIHRFIDRLADGIKDRDKRFECQPILVGSADEETKAVISADFDFNFKLIKFSQLCDVLPHPLGPNRYFQLIRKSDYTKKRQSDGEFDCFFNVEKCLLTSEVNSIFQIILEDVLHDPNFWHDENLFDWNLTETEFNKSEKTGGLRKTVRLRMIHPIEDGDGGLLFVDVSIHASANFHVEYSSLDNKSPIAPAGKADGCTLVIDWPRFDPSKPHQPYSVFSDTFSRISFAQLESRIVRESSSVIKAAYIVCKRMLYNNPKTTHQLKTSLLFCMESSKIREGCEKEDGDKITKKRLAAWVERLMFCFMKFCQQGFYPCYFMPSFKQWVGQMEHSDDLFRNVAKEVDVSLLSRFPFRYSAAFDMYLDLCPDDTTIDIPIIQHRRRHDLEGLIFQSKSNMGTI